MPKIGIRPLVQFQCVLGLKDSQLTLIFQECLTVEPLKSIIWPLTGYFKSYNHAQPLANLAYI